MKIRAILTVVLLLPLAFTGCGDDDKTVCSIDLNTQPVWDLDTLAIAHEVAVNGIWGVSQSEVYAVGVVDTGQGPAGVIWKHDGTTWAEVFSRPNSDLRDIHGTSSQGIWVAGIQDPLSFPDKSLILHWDGNSWQESLADPSLSGLLAIWTGGAGDVYTVESNGAILHYDGTAWSTEVTPIQNNPPVVPMHKADIWGVGAGSQQEIYAGLGSGIGAGIRGTVLRKNAGTWSVDLLTPDVDNGSIVVGVWVGSSNTAYALESTGRSGASIGNLYRRSDTAWIATSLSSESGVFSGIRGDDRGDLFVLGGGVYVLQDGQLTVYRDYPSYGAYFLNDVWINGSDVLIARSYKGFGGILSGDFSVTCVASP